MKKRLLVLCLIFLLLFSLCGCKSQEEKQAEQAKVNWNLTTDETKMGIYCALIKEYMLWTEDLGKNTPYPAMRRNVKGYMLSGGMTQAEALDSAAYVLLEEQAVFWRGMKDGIQITEQETRCYIEDNVLRELQDGESYQQVDEICRKEGIFFEDTVWAYENSYKMEAIAKLYGVKNEEEFATYKAEAIAAYQESDAYARFQVVVGNCRNLLEEDITDKERIKKADIYW